MIIVLSSERAKQFNPELRLFIIYKMVKWIEAEDEAGRPTGARVTNARQPGQGFAKFLKANKSEFYDTHRTYTHTFPDGREVEANMYHIDALPMFIRFLNEKWLPENANNYFKVRDPIALDYLPKLLITGTNGKK